MNELNALNLKSDNLESTFSNNLNFFRLFDKKIALLIENTPTVKFTLGIDHHNEFNIFCFTKLVIL